MSECAQVGSRGADGGTGGPLWSENAVKVPFMNMVKDLHFTLMTFCTFPNTCGAPFCF